MLGASAHSMLKPLQPRLVDNHCARCAARSKVRHPNALSRRNSHRPAALVTSSEEAQWSYTFNEYDQQANGEFWSLRPVLVAQRVLEIGAGLGVWFARTYFARGRDMSQLSSKQADQLRVILTKLGPAFVKIGQAISSRPDLLPPSYTDELEKLQDNLPSFSDAEAMRILTAELGQRPEQMFSELTPSPVAAASLGQVYKGRLRNGGFKVAVKVQRPQVREAIALDVFILRFLAKQARDRLKINSDLAALLDEWATSLFRELDYTREARNGIRFRELYRHLKGVYIPKMRADLTTQKVLIMEWVDGKRLRSAGKRRPGQSDNRAEDLAMVDIGVQCSLEQILEVGFYHSDPHPGNLLRKEGEEGGKLVYLDFGMTGTVQPHIRQGLIQATLHMVNQEFDLLAEDFITLGMLPAGSDMNAIVPALTRLFSKALANGASNISFGEMSNDLGRTMYEYQFRIPPYYTLLVRSLSVLEGIALSANPNYKVLGAAYPWIARRLLLDTAPELRETLRSLLYKNGRFQFSRLESLLKEAARSPARRRKPSDPESQTPELEAPSGEQALTLLLSPEGEFVREILLDELAKGLDAYWRLAADESSVGLRQRVLALLGEGGVQSFAASGLLGFLSRSRGPLASADDKRQLAGMNSLATALRDLSTAQDPPHDEQQGTRDQLQLPCTRPSSPPPTRMMQVICMREKEEAGIDSRHQYTRAECNVRVGGQEQHAGIRPTATSAAADDTQSGLREVAAAVQWVASQVPSLPQDAQMAAFRIPASLGVKLGQRLLARSLRSALVAPEQQPRLPERVEGNARRQPAMIPPPVLPVAGSNGTTPKAGGADQAAAALWTPANGVEMRREPGSRKTRGTSGRSTAGEAAARSEQYSASISG